METFKRNHTTITESNVKIIGDHNQIQGHGCVVEGNHNHIYGNDCDVHGDYTNVYGQRANVYGNHNISHYYLASCAAEGAHNNGFRQLRMNVRTPQSKPSPQVQPRCEASCGTEERHEAERKAKKLNSGELDISIELANQHISFENMNGEKKDLTLDEMINGFQSSEPHYKQLVALRTAQKNRLEEFKKTQEYELKLAVKSLYIQFTEGDAKEREKIATELLERAKHEEEKRKMEEQMKAQQGQIDFMKMMWQQMQQQQQFGQTPMPQWSSPNQMPMQQPMSIQQQWPQQGQWQQCPMQQQPMTQTSQENPMTGSS